MLVLATTEGVGLEKRLIAIALMALASAAPWAADLYETRMARAAAADLASAFVVWIVTGDTLVSVLVTLVGLMALAFMERSAIQTRLLAVALGSEIVKLPLLVAGLTFGADHILGNDSVSHGFGELAVQSLGRVGIVAAGFTFLRQVADSRFESLARIRASEERHLELLRRTPSALLVLDYGQVVYANPAAASLLGYPDAGALVGSSFPKLIDANHRRAVSNLFKATVETGQAQELRDLPMTGLDKVRRTIDVAATTVTFDGAQRLQVALKDVTEQHAAREALAEREIWFRSAFVDSATPFAIADLDTRLIAVNRALEGLLGAEEGTLLSCSWADLVHEDDRDKMNEFLVDALKGATDRVSSELRLSSSDGRVMWVLANVNVIRDVNGRPVRFFAQLFDITKRIAAEHAQAESEARYESLFEGLPVPLYRTTADGEFVDANPAMASLLGVDRHELFDRHVGEFYADPAQRDRFVSEMTLHGYGGDPEARLVTAAGREIVVQNSARTVEVGGRSVFEGALVEVTDRVDAQQQLRRRVAQQEIVAELGELALRSDLKQVFEAAAGAMATHLGGFLTGVFCTTDDSDLALHAGHGWPEEMMDGYVIAQGTSDQMRYILSAEAPVITDSLPDETRFRPSEFLLERGARAGVSAVIHGTSSPLGVVGVWSDLDRSFDEADVHFVESVANLLAAAIERQQAQDRLEGLVRSKDEFVASVSHELRTPLTVVNGMAHELRERWAEFTGDEIVEFVRLIADQSADMANLIEDLLVAARAEIGTVVIKNRPFEMRKEVEAVLAGFKESEQITLDVRPVPAVGDAARVRQVLRNLISNAFRYGGTEITVSASHVGDRALVVVSDNGEGVAPEDEDAIFEPYHRAHHHAGLPASVGLGLSVSKTLSELMGGTLEYHRREGHSYFEFWLPATHTATALREVAS